MTIDDNNMTLGELYFTGVRGIKWNIEYVLAMWKCIDINIKYICVVSSFIKKKYDEFQCLMGRVNR